MKSNRVRSLETQIELLRLKNSYLDNGNIKLVDVSEKLIDVSEKLEESMRDRENLERQVDVLRNEIIELEKHNEQVDELIDENQQLKYELQELEGIRERAIQLFNENEYYKDEVKRLRNSNIELEGEIHNLEKENDEFLEQFAEKDAKIFRLKLRLMNSKYPSANSPVNDFSGDFCGQQQPHAAHTWTVSLGSSWFVRHCPGKS